MLGDQLSPTNVAFEGFDAVGSGVTALAVPRDLALSGIDGLVLYMHSDALTTIERIRELIAE